MAAWALMLAGTAVRGWRLPVVLALLGGASWLATRSAVSRTKVGRTASSTAYGVLSRFAGVSSNQPAPERVFTTSLLVPRALRSGRAGYAAVRLGSRARGGRHRRGRPGLLPRFPRPDGTLVVGHSLSMAVAAAAAWVALLTAVGWLRVRRSGIPLR